MFVYLSLESALIKSRNSNLNVKVLLMISRVKERMKIACCERRPRRCVINIRRAFSIIEEFHSIYGLVCQSVHSDVEIGGNWLCPYFS